MSKLSEVVIAKTLTFPIEKYPIRNELGQKSRGKGRGYLKGVLGVKGIFRARVKVFFKMPFCIRDK